MIPTRTFDLLERLTKSFPGQNVLAEKIDGNWISYTSEQYNEIAHQFAYGLLELGFQKGGCVNLSQAVARLPVSAS